MSPNTLSRSGGFIILVLASFLQGCGGSSEPTPTEAQRVTLLMKSGPWKIQEVKVDGTNQNGLFTGLTLSFSDTGFTTTNGGVVWPASGTWAFVDAQATSFKRNDNIIVTILEISSNSLIIQLTWDKTTLGPGRIASIAGQTVFTFGH